MKKVKKEKREKSEGPVSYNRSIIAAFEKQNRGKTCPLCQVKFSLASYRSHMDECKVEENDCEISVIASYSREEAILLRAGPEIVLEDVEPSEKSDPKRRRTIQKENVEPSTSEPCVAEKPIKSSPEWENRRRSSRLQRKLDASVVKKESATIQEVLRAIENCEEGKTPEQPYYMKCFLKIIKRVISTRKFDGTFYSDDFWAPDDVITLFRFVDQISTSAKCLLIRLFIRKPGWYHLEKLEQRYPEIPEISKAADELARWKFIEDESSLKSLDDAIALSDVSVLKNVAKKFQIDSSKNRQEIVQAIRKFGQSQKTIFGGGGSTEGSILRNLKKELGKCVRIRENLVELFKALCTLYCPISTNSANSIDNPSGSSVYQELLFMMLSIENGSVTFPAPNPCPNIVSFYQNRKMLFDYISAKSVETSLVTLMTAGALETAFDLALEARDCVENLSGAEKKFCERLEVHERKLTAAWVLVRCCGHGATILEKQKKWGMAVEWQSFLLRTQELKHYCLDSRGIWWDRLLLNLDSHLKEKDECAKMMRIAMEDDTILEKELLTIQDRALKLKTDIPLKIHIDLPEKKTISAPTITKNLADGRINRFVIKDAENGEEVECSVEEVVRSRYILEEGFMKGVHDEGATWHTLFGLLFYDIIFPDDVNEDASTWLSELQDCPSDLSNSLYAKRSAKFDERFEWLSETDDEHIEHTIRGIWSLKHAETNRQCAWKTFPNGVDDVVELFHCIPRKTLISVFERLAKNYRNCRSGFPDLTLWNREIGKVAVVEVKGPGDRLSTKQRLWLAFFAENGIRAEVCHVAAENPKRL